MARQFGIITTTTGITNIVVTGITTTKGADIAEARDSAGKVTDLKAYSENESINVNGLLDAASISISAGASLTLGGKSYIVENVTITETNTEFATASITARRADSATISPVTSGGTSAL